MKSQIKNIKLICVAAVFLTSCRSAIDKTRLRLAEKWKPFLNTEITIVGTAEHSKGGAIVYIKKDSTIIWIENTHWPLDYSTKENQSTIIEVTGMLIEKYDLPVFRDKKHGNTKKGIPRQECQCQQE